MTMLEMKNITLNYANRENPILKEINYTINQGDFVILLGSNGSGKSSLLKILYRQYQADIGTVTLLQQPLQKFKAKEFSSKVAVLTQDFSESLFTSLTVYENFLLMAEINKQYREFFQRYIRDFNPNLADKLDCTMDQLSGGEKQALALALRLLQPPALLLLDEHTSALDPKTSEQIMQLTQAMAKKHNITCVLTTHNLDIALRYGNKIVMLREGEIFKEYNCAEKALLSKEELAANYF